jgi:predicted lipid-binding transport protein (Tim44 family)
MSKWLLALCAVILGGALVITDADAKRFGGSRSVGAQRSITNTPPASTPARPAQQQAAPAQQQPAPSGLSRWMPILGGLALGGLLGSMFGGSGLGGILMIALLAVVAVVALRAFARRREEAAPQPMQMAGMGNERLSAAMPAQISGLDSAAPAPAAPSVPQGFDTAGFLRAAKLNFVRLQVANDQGKLDEIREFTTQEMFDELRKDVAGRTEPQHTDVMNLDADLLEVATERDKHWASVRFSGTIRESAGAAPEGFTEVWNLVKPADGSSGWLLAGIQQMH